MSAVAPSEVTEASIRNRIKLALDKAGVLTEAAIKDRIKLALEGHTISDVPDADSIYREGNFSEIVEHQPTVDSVFEDGKFAEIVGVVGKAVTATRLYASQVCTRHGKGQIARQIREGR